MDRDGERDRYLVAVPGPIRDPQRLAQRRRRGADRHHRAVGDDSGGCANATLRFWIRITTAEYENLVYDRLTVTLGGTTLASYSNLDKTTGYVEKVVNVGQFAGQTATLTFNGVEDWSYQTSFVIDDVTISAS
ncbi:hypothetical protein GCM10027614_07640 [Micromonospora vulcania]